MPALVSSGAEARKVNRGLAKARARARAKPKPKPKPRITSGEQARAVATQRAATRPRNAPITRSSTDAQQGGYPGTPIREVRRRNGKVLRTSSGKPSVRTFRNADDYKAYDSRLQAKAQARAGVKARARRRALVDLATLTPAGHRAAKTRASDIRSQVKQESAVAKTAIAARKTRITGQEAAATRQRQNAEIDTIERQTRRRVAQASRTAKANLLADQKRGAAQGLVRQPPKAKREKAVRQAQRAALRRAEPQIQQLGHEMKVRQESDVASRLPPRGTSVEAGVQAGQQRQKERAEAAALRKAHVNRRKGGVSRWLKNARDDIKDAVTSIPAQGEAAASAGLDAAMAAGELGQGHDRHRLRHGGTAKDYGEGLVKGYLDSSVLVPLVKGDVKEALGRLKERPVSGALEVAPVAGAAAKTLRASSAAARVVRRHGPGAYAGKSGRRVRVPERARRSFSDDMAQEVAERAAARRQRAPLKAGQVRRHRRYSGNTGVRIVQKAKDRGVRAAGGDPDTASTRGGRHSKHSRVLRRHTDETLRNIQHGNQAREERAHSTVVKAQKRGGAKRSTEKRAALELMTRHARLREGDPHEVEAELERIATFHERGGDGDNARIVRKLAARHQRDWLNSYIMRPASRQAAAKLAEQAHKSDAEAVRRGYLSETQARSTAARQSLIESGRIVPEGEYRPRKGGRGGEGPTPSPPSAATSQGAAQPPPAGVASPRKRGQPKSSARDSTIPQPSTSSGAESGSKVTVRRITPEPERGDLARRKAQLDAERRGLRTLEGHKDVATWNRKNNAVVELEQKLQRVKQSGRGGDPEMIEAALQSARRERLEAGKSHSVRQWKAQGVKVRELERPDRVSDDDQARGNVRQAKESAADAIRQRQLLSDHAAVRTWQKYDRKIATAGARLKTVRGELKSATPDARKRLLAEEQELKDKIAKARDKRAEHAARPEAQRWLSARERAAALVQAEKETPRPKTSGPAMNVQGGRGIFDEGTIGVATPTERTRIVARPTAKPPRDVKPKVVSQEQAQTVKVDVSRILESPGSERYVWAHDGTPVTNQGAIEANPRGAFLRGRPLESDETNLLLGVPHAGTGYSPADLLTTKLGQRQVDAELEKSRRAGLARLTQQVQDTYALRDSKGQMQVFEDEAAAKRAAAGAGPGRWVAHAYFDKGPHWMVLPAEVDKRVRGQLAPPGRIERAGRYAMRQAIRATLPFSILWHAGNVADLSLRLALTTSPRDWARRGPELARLLERQMTELDPDLADELLSTLKGHFGSRQTVRDPRATDFLYDPKRGVYAFPRLASVANKLGDAVKSLPPTKIIDKAFDLTSSLEGSLVRRGVGAEARKMAEELGHHMDDASAQMRALAKDLVDDPAKVHALQARVLEIVGDFSTRSPRERKALHLWDPYWQWLKAANRFVFLTLPERHPIKTALLLQGASMTADERTRMGLNYYWTDEEYEELAAKLGSAGDALPSRGDEYTSGALPGPKGGIIPTTPFTSFGEAGGLLENPARLLDRPASYFTRPATAAFGYYGSPASVARKALPGGGEMDDVKIKEGGRNAKYDRALQLATEGFIPGTKQVRQLREGGSRPRPHSTAWHPRSDAFRAGHEPKSLRGGVSKVLNPLHEQVRPPVKDNPAQPAVAAPGEFFQVKMRNLDGSWTIFWAKRER